MKRDWDLIRRILLKLEEKANNTDFLLSSDFPPFDSPKVAYHFELLYQAGLIVGEPIRTIGHSDFYAQALTWQGHELLDKIRQDTVWNKIKSIAREKSLDLTLDSVKLIAGKLIEIML